MCIFPEARPFVDKLFRIIKERSYVTITSGTLVTAPTLQPKNSVAASEKRKDTDDWKEMKDKKESIKRKSANQSEKEKEQKVIILTHRLTIIS